MITAALILIAAAPAAAATPAEPADPQVVYSDPAHDVAVRYDLRPASVEFSAHLPAGWSFTVRIDGDQDGRWGQGPDSEKIEVRPTADRKFGQDSRNGVFCSQYILSSDPQDPSDVYASSECGGLPSKGVVEMTGFDAHMRATITLKIPYEEIFGTQSNAHLGVCVWDTQRTTCQHSLDKPYVLTRPPAAVPGQRI